MEYEYLNNTIIIRQPDSFRLSETLECGQCFRFEKLADEQYVIVAFGKAVKAEEADGNIIITGLERDEFELKWKHYFDLDRDYSLLKAGLCENDEIMREAVKFAPGIRILNQDFFECLISFIISQNNRIPMIKKVISNISEKYGNPIGEINGVTYYSFPTPEALGKADIESLMALKTGFRAKYIMDAVEKIINGDISRQKLDKMSLEEARNTLMTIKGVGPKVADCVLLFSLERSEVFPKDVWIKRVMEYFYFNGEDTKKEEIQKKADALYGNMQGFAQQYLFNYARTLKIGTK